FFGVSSLTAFGRNYHVISEAAQNSSRFALRVFFDSPRRAFGNLEIPVNAAEFQRQAVQRGIGASAEHDRMPGRDTVQLGAGRVTLLAQPGDEDLLQFDPLACLDD